MNYDIQNAWFISDTHFNQERTFQLSRRTMYFKDLEESTEKMIENWNNLVGEDDFVFHLGDFGDYSVAERLNGNIILLFGNYEHNDYYKGTLTDEMLKKYFYTFESDWFGLSDLGDSFLERLILVHEPEKRMMVVNEIKDELNFDYSDAFYLFGHIHEKQKVKRNGLNVGVDVHNFAPVSWDTIEFYAKAIREIYDANCFDNF